MPREINPQLTITLSSSSSGEKSSRNTEEVKSHDMNLHNDA